MDALRKTLARTLGLSIGFIMAAVAINIGDLAEGEISLNFVTRIVAIAVTAAALLPVMWAVEAYRHHRRRQRREKSFA